MNRLYIAFAWIASVLVGASAQAADSSLVQEASKLPWTAATIDEVKAQYSTKDEVESLVNAVYAQDPNEDVASTPAHIQSFTFANLHGDGTFQLIATVDFSGRELYTNLAVIDNQNGKMTFKELHTNGAEFASKIDSVVVDLHHDGSKEIFVPRLLGKYGDEQTSGVISEVYRWNGKEYANDSKHFKDYYQNTVIPNIKRTMEKVKQTKANDKSQSSAQLHQRIVQEQTDMYNRELEAINKIINN